MAIELNGTTGITTPDITSTAGFDSADLTGDIAASQITSALNATGSAPLYTARAWVNFNGTGTVAIRASGNVSSITDNGTGDYTVNFTTAMPDANYVATVAAGGTGSLRFSNISGDTAQTSSLIRVSCGSATTTLIDLAFVEIAIFR